MLMNRIATRAWRNNYVQGSSQASPSAWYSPETYAKQSNTDG